MIDGGVEDKADVRPLDLEVAIRIVRDADLPVDDAVGFSVDGRLSH